MNINKFEKVSLAQFTKDMKKEFPIFNELEVADMHEKLELPSRATEKSAGYDFQIPFDIYLAHGESIKIPTGIKANMEDGKVLKCYPRSSLGFKYFVRFANSTGIIDGDYYNNEDNEGHIFAKIRNEGDKGMSLNAGDNFFQAIFTDYYLTIDDQPRSKIRVGGIGSSNK